MAGWFELGYGSSPLLYDDSPYIQVVTACTTQAASYCA
jgi:hypothetical protein